MKQVRYIATLCLILLLLSSCSLFKNTSKTVKTVKESAKVEKVKETLEDKSVGKKEVKQTEDKKTTDKSKESKVEFKGDLEVIENVKLDEGLNVLETKSGGTVFVVKKDDEVSLVINRPDITVFNKDFNLVDEYEKGLEERFSNTSDIKYSNEGESTSNDRASNENNKRTTPSLKVILIMIGLITGLGILIYIKFKN